MRSPNTRNPGHSVENMNSIYIFFKVDNLKYTVVNLQDKNEW